MRNACKRGYQGAEQNRTAARVLSTTRPGSSRDWGFDSSVAEHCEAVLATVESDSEGRTEGLYLVQEEDKYGALKIGVTADTIARMRTLQVGNPRPLFLLGWIVAPRGLEKIIHSILIHDSITGEWFRPTPHAWGVIAWYFASVGLESCAECDHETRYKAAGLLKPQHRIARHTCGRPSSQDGALKHAELVSCLREHMAEVLVVSESA